MTHTGDSDSHPSMTRSDAWLLAALTEGSHDGRPVNLRQLVNDADWLNRSIPTFDELSFGLPRLVDAGFLTVRVDPNDGLLLSATSQAIRLRESVKAKTLGDVMIGMQRVLGARPFPEPETEDRSLDRLPGLEPEAVESAIRNHGESVGRSVRPFVVAVEALHKLVKRVHRRL